MLVSVCCCFKQKTAYEMRISDWSSDVCSSDLSVAVKVLGPYSSEEQRQLWMAAHGYLDPLWQRYLTWLGHVLTGDFGESIRFKAIGRASCRERVCQYV